MVPIRVIIFPVLSALAVNFIFGHSFKSGLINHMTGACPARPVSDPSDFPFRLAYTGIHLLDSILCMLGAFFSQNFTSNLSPFFFYFTASGFVVDFFPIMEANRIEHSSLLTHTIIMGLLVKFATVAVVIPIYWFILILTGSATVPTRRTGERNFIARDEVEAVIFGFVVGNIIPTIVMLVTQHPRAIAFWQFCPPCVYLAQKIYKAIRPRAGAGSGYSMLRNFYVGLFILAASSHINYVWPRLTDITVLKLFMVPSLHALPPATTSFAAGASDFMKWNFSIGFFSSIMVTFWFTNTGREFFFMMGWQLLATILVGPSAGVIAAVIWRESVMNALTGNNPVYLN